MYVPTFQVRNSTGPFVNRSVCHVCRNGDRPVVMVVMREVGPKQRMLLRNIDRSVTTRRGEGLRAFGVFLGDRPREDFDQIRTFAFNGRIEMPVGLSSPSLADQSLLDIPADAETTVFLYENRRVVSRTEFKPGAPNHEQLRDLLDAIGQLGTNQGGHDDGLPGSGE
jgi:hypothetical protein